MDPPGQSGGGLREGLASGVGRRRGENLPGKPARRRSITGEFCFGAVPYTVQEHDCRGIIAATAGCVQAIGWRTTRATVATGVIRRKAGCSCARTRVAGFRW